MKEPSSNWAIVPATGLGRRMGSDRPKQYLQLGGKSILELTLDNLLSHQQISGAVIVINSSDSFWHNLDYSHEKPILLCHGGERRHDSVKNGLLCLQKHTNYNPMVLIHDAVRPFVSHTDLDKLIESAWGSKSGAILGAPVSDTLKKISSELQIDQTVDRDHLWRAYTPQAFRLELLLEAITKASINSDNITDDASAIELLGLSPKMINSSSLNIKITHPQDLILAELIYKKVISKGGSEG